MFDALSFAEINGQHVELLPARTTMALLDLQAMTPRGGGGDLLGLGTPSNVSLLICP